MPFLSFYTGALMSETLLNILYTADIRVDDDDGGDGVIMQ